MTFSILVSSVTVYSWAAIKLVAATTVTPGVHSVIYQYDPLGRHFAKSVDGTVTQFLSDQSEEIGEYTSGGTLLRRYIYGPGVDEQMVRIEYSSGSETARYYYHMDAQGSVIADTTGTGAIADRYVYDPYGNSADGLTGNPIRYTGRRFDPETGLYYYRARYYSPMLGRFLQTDPIGYGDNMNMYGYVGNDPLSFRDPSGMKKACTTIENVTICKPIDDGPDFSDYGVAFPPLLGIQLYKYCQSACSGPEKFGLNLALSIGPAKMLVEALEALESLDEAATEYEDSSQAQTGIAPQNLKEQLAVEQAKSSPKSGRVIDIPMKDSRWPGKDGWVKMQQKINGINVHYVYNQVTDAVADFKIKR